MHDAGIHDDDNASNMEEHEVTGCVNTDGTHDETHKGFGIVSADPCMSAMKDIQQPGGRSPQTSQESSWKDPPERRRLSQLH